MTGSDKGGWLAMGVGLGIVGLLVTARVFVFDLWVLDSDTMEPGLQAGDVLLVMRHRRVQPGDVVLLHVGDDPKRYARRIVAVGGSQVEMAQGHLYADGQALGVEERPVTAYTWHCGREAAPARVEQDRGRRWTVIPGRDDLAVQRVPDHEVWVLGDQRPHSRDSRTWGSVPLDGIEGTLVQVLWHRDLCQDPGATTGTPDGMK